MRLSVPHLLCGVGLTLIAGGLLVSCKPDVSPRAKEAAGWLADFYKRYTIRGGWGVFGIEAKDNKVEVAVTIPDGQTKDLKEFDEAKRKGFIAYNACPPFSEQVWSTLEADGDIIILARNKGVVFATASCRADNRGMPL